MNIKNDAIKQVYDLAWQVRSCAKGNISNEGVLGDKTLEKHLGALVNAALEITHHIDSTQDSGRRPDVAKYVCRACGCAEMVEICGCIGCKQCGVTGAGFVVKAR